MDKDTLLKALAGTLDANPHTRRESEQLLHVFEKQPGFTSYLLDLIVEDGVPLGIQISGAIFFKNRVSNYWLAPEDKAGSPVYIQAFEKSAIKEKLIQTLMRTYRAHQLKLQLTTALQKILNSEKWEELLSVIKTLLSDSSNVDSIYTGLLCLFEYSKCYRWTSLETGSGNPVFEEITTEVFPILEPLVNSLIESTDESSLIQDEMLYLIVKIFKYITFSTLPSYFKENPSKLGAWCHYHILIINKPLPQSVMNEESLEARTQHPRIKAVKWCFGNLHRLLSRHGGGHATGDKTSEFATQFMQTFVPEILSVYWTIIENWSSKKIWISEGSLYQMISFLEQLIDTPAWPLIEDKLEAIVRHVLLPTLNANSETVELYEDEPEEYIRRFFDINRESNTSDVASINFVFRLSSKRFKSTINLLLTIINDVMSRRASPDRDDLATAMEVEGAFRILSTLSHKLDKKYSPVAGKIDTILHTFVYPELSPKTIQSTPFLTARACDTIAMFVNKYRDQQILQDIFQGIVVCFQTQEHLPIQITAVDALRTLVEEELVAEHIAGQAPQLMGTLLDMSKKFESDILTSVMDAFVEKFAKNLEPYANELALRLTEQFIKLASDILEQQSTSGSNNTDIEKEYQAAGILTTLTTLVIAMNSSPQVASSLEEVLQDMIKFVLENAMVSFLPEIVEILESVTFSTQRISPIMWGLYQACIDSFETYALEYFDTYQPFFESVINIGFSDPNETIESPHVQALIGVCFNILRSEAFDPIFGDCAFELIEMTILSMNARFVPFLPRFLPEIFDVFSLLEAQEAFDGHMLHHLSILKIFFACFYIDPTTTLQFLQGRQFTAGIFQLWIKYSDSFQSVYGCKLQILAGLSILCDADWSMFEQEPDTVRELVDLLVSNLETLPHAIRAKQEILAKESSVRQMGDGLGGDDEDEDEDEYSGAYGGGDEYEADEAELEALKQTPIDGVHVFEVFTNKIILLQQNNQKYKAIFGDLDEQQLAIVNKVLEVSQQHLKAGF